MALAIREKALLTRLVSIFVMYSASAPMNNFAMPTGQSYRSWAIVGGGKFIRATLGMVRLLEGIRQSHLPPVGPFSAELAFNGFANDVLG